MRVAFQGEPGAFSEAAARQLLGTAITTVPRATFDSAFHALDDGSADALMAPIENTLAGSVVRVYDLLLESKLTITAETILPIEHHLIGFPGVSLEQLRSVASHPMEKGDRSAAAIAGRRAAEFYGGAILAESIQDNAENFTRFVLLRPPQEVLPEARKMSLAMRLAHRPGALLSSLEPFAAHGVNLLKIESRPIHGRPWEYQFFLDVEAESLAELHSALAAARSAASEIQVLGLYVAARGSFTNARVQQ